MINLILFCMGTASLTMFLNVCMQKGMIFRRYYNLITYWFALPRNKPRSCKITREGQVLYRYPRFIKSSYFWLWKMLCGCYYCYGTHIFIWTYLISAFFILQGNFLSLALNGFLGLGFNYVFIKAIERL
jgi:hypothetical protein